MTQVAVLLSGCGVFDGSEINEAVLTLLSIDKLGAQYQCLAPNIEQHHVINHLTQEEMPERRNVLVESARIARGDVLDLSLAKAKDYDAVILPGGYGAAKNLSNFAFKGSNCDIHPLVKSFLSDAISQGLPVGFLCIAPSMIPLLYPKGVKMTIGTDEKTASAIAAMGAEHIECMVTSIVTDTQYKVVSTPAYMLANSIFEAQQGIEALVKQVIELSN